MPSSAAASANYSFCSVLFLTLFIVCLFPGLFNYIITLPFSFLFASSSSPTPPSQPTHTPTMSWSQKQFTLPPKSRGSYLITDHVVQSLPEIKQYKAQCGGGGANPGATLQVGLLNLFVQHTSCALSLNENWDDDVRADMSDALDRIAPEAGPKGQDLYRHSAEGPDDMPAHIKSALIGASVTVPIKDGKLVSGPDRTLQLQPVRGKESGIWSSGR
ncbi:hypothetical protein JX265_002568 [Neoarthrinium moseri]|uniref:Uncharacterized protein n=1 Tax=Neoarthrinium moseri TaxID=1658444 RepID=A0A9Q0AT47_9PEZI|nr:uncharacterized protein JN550_000382 [Neoarthrinium moseri]KAI1854929.1 hypothetical protein JX266_001047 [Neoarthrinium moseri]KAI1878200.1 hypothetical protein JN550_000382 [Neoarthrinium moseri]KAI1879614.1 hypothetical protein JX265_002568 [Neoarthrinium moseri]